MSSIEDQEMDLMESKMDELFEKTKKLSALINKNLKEKNSAEFIMKLIEKLEQLATEELKIKWKFCEMNGKTEEDIVEFHRIFTNRTENVKVFKKRLLSLIDYVESLEEELIKRGLVCSCSGSGRCNCA
jgi:Asp-tRNA(Asn)/Glu-tRNA(Gln) amidotransferase C subunit